MVIYGYMLTLFLSIAYYEFQSQLIYDQMLDASFMCFVFLGVMIEWMQREKKFEWKYIFLCILINLLTFKISAYLFQDGASRMSYPNCVTQVFPVLLFLLFLRLEDRFPEVYKRVPQFFYLIGKLVLPYYLIHVACGISVMLWLSKVGCGFYVILLGGVATTFGVSTLIYFGVTKPSAVLMKKTIKAMRKEK